MNTNNSDFFHDKTWGFNTQWSENASKRQAEALGLNWSPELLSLVAATQAFYLSYDHSPSMRPLLKHLQSTVDPTLTSIKLQIQLRANPALVLAYLAGIPRPKQCF